MKAKTILVVEDEPDLLSLLTQKLTQEHFKPVGAATGQQALDFLRQHKPDLVLLDILLPDIDGLTILHEIAQRPDAAELPVIILSNLDEQGSFEQAAAIGNYEYLVKAKTDLTVLVKKIRGYLEKSDS